MPRPPKFSVANHHLGCAACGRCEPHASTRSRLVVQPQMRPQSCNRCGLIFPSKAGLTVPSAAAIKPPGASVVPSGRQTPLRFLPMEGGRRQSTQIRGRIPLVVQPQADPLIPAENLSELPGPHLTSEASDLQSQRVPHRDVLDALQLGVQQPIRCPFAACSSCGSLDGCRHDFLRLTCRADQFYRFRPRGLL